MNQAATRKAQTYSPHLEYLRFLRETIHARAKPFSIIIFTPTLKFHTNIFTSEKILKEKKKRAFHNNNNDR